LKKTIVITGVGKGFGRGLFESLSNKYTIIGVTRSQEDANELEGYCSVRGLHSEIIVLDVADYESLQKLLVPLLNKYNSSLWGLINNAGVRCRKSLEDLSLAEIKEVAEVNLFAPIFLTKIFLTYIKSNGSGRIINISSILSQKGLKDLSAYAVSKAGLDGFTRSVAVEYGQYGITCNSVLAGFCKTSYFDKFKSNEDLYQFTIDRTPMRRWGESNEIVGLCDFLLSDYAGYINGASIPVDGGWLA
jgi:NAD(P)-dependent dehydrogenase (short-subunit alcohol dehydrogenase family)